MKKILVTGGAGFIGSNFIRFILQNTKRYEIVNLDKLTYAGNLDNLKDVIKNPKYSFFKGDICDKNVVEKLVKKCDIIINFAAETHVDRSIVDDEQFIKTNICGTNTLLKAALKYKIKKFVQISTDEVYGSLKEGSFKETDALKPNNPYSASKASADMLVRSFNSTYDLPTVIIRSSNNFGPFQYPEKLIPFFTTNAIEDKKLPLYGDGLNTREWTFVIDNCNGIKTVMENGKIGEIYNLGSGQLKTNLGVTNKILEYLGKSKSQIEYVKDRLGHDSSYVLNSKKIRKLGWKPKYKFDDALGSTINWYKDNKWWWKN
ncbi:MAG: dTDP-glucose 4,6-dehydratase [Candidatus Cloacimonetes bacterium]|nr:dTDP-glucose 4,6-dehydratase [Candidatus Cloacimonadota bacterium]